MVERFLRPSLSREQQNWGLSQVNALGGPWVEYGLDASGVGQHAHFFPSHLVIISNGWLCQHISLHINVNYVKAKFIFSVSVNLSFSLLSLFSLLISPIVVW